MTAGSTTLTEILTARCIDKGLLWRFRAQDSFEALLWLLQILDKEWCSAGFEFTMDMDRSSLTTHRSRVTCLHPKEQSFHAEPQAVNQKDLHA